MALTKVVGGVIADSSITSTDITDCTITNAKMSVDPSNASNLSSGSVPAAQLDNIPTDGLQGDIALLAFKTQANGNLARYNLVDQSVDSFEDDSGVNSAASTNDARSGTGKYYSGAAGAASGGTEVISGGYKYHTFLADGNLTVSGTLSGVEYLVVAGGGGGGGQTTTNWGSGGGGGGGYRSATGQTLAAGTHAVVVGAGGAGGASGGNNGTSGGVSSFNSLESAGGGGGGTISSTPGAAGGSGGGGSVGSGGAGNTPSTSPAQGFNGGASYNNSPSCSDECSGGGGGGATEAGGWTSGGRESDVNGGAGSNSHSAWATITSTGDSGYFSGGGGGGDGNQSTGVSNTGGAGGGAKGGDGSGGDGATATANTGGGGGGSAFASGDGGDGGSGVVIIRAGTQAPANMTLISNSVTAQAQPTKADVVLTYTNGAGTATINTDLIASVSRDNGTTYTPTTLVLQGTTGGHTILTANNVDISAQPAGTSMIWKIATANQSVSKDTRIHAVSLGWS